MCCLNIFVFIKPCRLVLSQERRINFYISISQKIIWPTGTEKFLRMFIQRVTKLLFHKIPYDRHMIVAGIATRATWTTTGVRRCEEKATNPVNTSRRCSHLCAPTRGLRNGTRNVKKAFSPAGSNSLPRLATTIAIYQPYLLHSTNK